MIDIDCLLKRKPFFIWLFYVAIAIMAGWVMSKQGMPFSNPDDPFYGGAAVYFAEQREVIGPHVGDWLARITGYSYPYPTVYPKVIGTLLSVNKDYAVNFPIIQIFFISATMVLAAGVLKREGYSWWSICGVNCALLGFLMYRGFRPDAFALSIIMLGWLFLTYRSFVMRCLGFAALGLGSYVLPYYVVFIVPLTLVGLCGHLTQEVQNSFYSLLAKLASTLAVGAVITLTIIWFLDEGFWDRLTAYRGYSQIVFKEAANSSWLSQVAEGIKSISNGYNFYLYGLAACLIVWRASDASKLPILAVGALGTSLVIIMFLYFGFLQNALWWAVVGAAALSFNNHLASRWQRNCYKTAYVVAVLILPLLLLSVQSTQRMGLMSDSDRLAILNKIDGQDVFFDTAAWRYIFRMLPPSQMRSLHYAGDFETNYWQDVVISREEQIPEQTYTLSSASMMKYIFPALEINISPLVFGGRRFNSLPSHRDDFVLYRKESGKLAVQTW
jgi:hypothetical protein